MHSIGNFVPALLAVLLLSLVGTGNSSAFGFSARCDDRSPPRFSSRPSRPSQLSRPTRSQRPPSPPPPVAEIQTPRRAPPKQPDWVRNLYREFGTPEVR